MKYFTLFLHGFNKPHIGHSYRSKWSSYAKKRKSDVNYANLCDENVCVVFMFGVFWRCGRTEQGIALRTRAIYGAIRKSTITDQLNYKCSISIASYLIISQYDSSKRMHSTILQLTDWHLFMTLANPVPEASGSWEHGTPTIRFHLSLNSQPQFHHPRIILFSCNKYE